MQESLLAWFKDHKRDLPWRNERAPYRVWIAETMLQQTQVSTVIPYFERWTARFPDIQALALAPLDNVLKAWEGLGYYRRARLLHRAAKELMANYEGELPGSYEALRQLPGIGSYTAAAIASLAFGERVLTVDGNVRRVAARLFMLSPVLDREVKRRLTPYLPADGAGTFNEALMELGARVCRPVSPSCPECPLRVYCAAFREGRVADFPPKVKKIIPHVQAYALLYGQNGALWLRRRDEEEMLGGLWGFPLVMDPVPGKALPEVKHAYTHFRISATPLVVNKAPVGPGSLVALEQLDRLALSKLDHKLLAAYLQLDAEPEHDSGVEAVGEDHDDGREQHRRGELEA